MHPRASRRGKTQIIRSEMPQLTMRQPVVRPPRRQPWELFESGRQILRRRWVSGAPIHAWAFRASRQDRALRCCKRHLRYPAAASTSVGAAFHRDVPVLALVFAARWRTHDAATIICRVRLPRRRRLERCPAAIWCPKVRNCDKMPVSRKCCGERPLSFLSLTSDRCSHANCMCEAKALICLHKFGASQSSRP